MWACNVDRQSVTAYIHHILLLLLKTHPLNINIIQVYAPMAEAPEDELEQLNKDIGSM